MVDRLIIDSSSRDREFHPRPDLYEVRLPDDYEMVTAISLVSASIPFSQRLIHPHNNTIVITIGGTDHAVVLPESDPADEAGFLAILLHGLNDIPGVTFAASVGSLDRLLTIYTTDGTSFALKTLQPQMARMLGIVPNTTIVSSFNPNVSQQATTSLYKLNLLGIEQLYLRIEFPDTSYIRSPSLGADRCFAAIFKPSANLTTELGTTTPIFEKRYDPPLAKFDRIRIAFQDVFGNQYDFQNNDHTLVFQIERAQPKQWRDWGL